VSPTINGLVSVAPDDTRRVAVTIPTFRFGLPARLYAVVAADTELAPETVAMPEPNVTSRLVPKSIVAAVPTMLPLSLISIPEPVETTPNKLLPSIAGRTPVSCPAFNVP